MKRIAWFVIFLIMGVSCLDQPDCYRQNLNLIGISFKKLHDGEPDTVSIYKVTGDDYVFPGYADTVETASISVELNHLHKGMTLVIEGLSKKDNFQFSYLAKSQFVSEDCGARFIISDLKILSHSSLFKDSVRFVSNSPSNPPGTNIVIYRCPRMNIMRFSFRQLYMNTDTLGKEDPRIIKTIAINSVTYKQNSTPTKSLLFPLDTTKQSVSYAFAFDNEEKNVSLTYKVFPNQTIEKKCGFQSVIGSLEKTSTNFSLLKIANDSIYDPPHTNIISYRCAITNQVGILFRIKKGDSKADSVKITNLTADYPADLSAYADTTVTSLILPLNPLSSTQFTKFTFEIDGQPKVLFLNYDTEEKIFYKGCGTQTVFTALTADQSTGFTTQTILDTNIKFPAVYNVEIIK